MKMAGPVRQMMVLWNQLKKNAGFVVFLLPLILERPTIPAGGRELAAWFQVADAEQALISQVSFRHVDLPALQFPPWGRVLTENERTGLWTFSSIARRHQPRSGRPYPKVSGLPQFQEPHPTVAERHRHHCRKLVTYILTVGRKLMITVIRTSAPSSIGQSILIVHQKHCVIAGLHISSEAMDLVSQYIRANIRRLCRIAWMPEFYVDCFPFRLGRSHERKTSGAAASSITGSIKDTFPGLWRELGLSTRVVDSAASDKRAIPLAAKYVFDKRTSTHVGFNIEPISLICPEGVRETFGGGLRLNNATPGANPVLPNSI